jgi:hypothetical protein
VVVGVVVVVGSTHGYVSTPQIVPIGGSSHGYIVPSAKKQRFSGSVTVVVLDGVTVVVVSDGAIVVVAGVVVLDGGSAPGMTYVPGARVVGGTVVVVVVVVVVVGMGMRSTSTQLSTAMQIVMSMYGGPISTGSAGGSDWAEEARRGPTKAAAKSPPANAVA